MWAQVVLSTSCILASASPALALAAGSIEDDNTSRPNRRTVDATRKPCRIVIRFGCQLRSSLQKEIDTMSTNTAWATPYVSFYSRGGDACLEFMQVPGTGKLNARHFMDVNARKN